MTGDDNRGRCCATDQRLVWEKTHCFKSGCKSVGSPAEVVNKQTLNKESSREIYFCL